MFESQDIIKKPSGNGITSEAKTESSSRHANKNALMKLKSYMFALRVWSLSASIIPTILGKLSKSQEKNRVVQQVPWHSSMCSQKKMFCFRFSVRLEGSKLDL